MRRMPVGSRAFHRKANRKPDGESWRRPELPRPERREPAFRIRLLMPLSARSSLGPNGSVDRDDGKRVRRRTGAAGAVRRHAGGTGGGGVMAEARSAEEVMEREMKRFQERYKRAQKQADEAKAQVEKLERALATLRNSDKPTK